VKRWSDSIKSSAIKLRQNGDSYEVIRNKFLVPKSTLSGWLKDLPSKNDSFNNHRNQWLKTIRPLALEAKKKKKEYETEKMVQEVERDVKEWFHLKSKETQIAILASLYWAEGSKGKEVLTFANTNPKLQHLFITLLRECFPLDESKFRVRLHLHYYHKIKEVEKYWSDLLKIPLSQFNKTFIKKRGLNKTFRRNVGGICFIKYNSVYLQRRLMQYAYIIGDKFTEHP